MEVRTATAASLGALAVGVTIAVDPAGLSPFGPAKWLVVGTLGVLLVATSVADPVTLTRVEAAFLGTFAVLVVIATARARDGRYAWSGTPDRHFGALGWLIVGGCYLAGRRLDRDGLRTVARACSLAAAAIGGWCAWELAAGRPVELVTTTARLTGPFGSAAISARRRCSSAVSPEVSRHTAAKR